MGDPGLVRRSDRVVERTETRRGDVMVVGVFADVLEAIFSLGIGLMVAGVTLLLGKVLWGDIRSEVRGITELVDAIKAGRGRHAD